VKTASGDVSLGTVEAGGALTTVSGDLSVGQVNGSLTARAVSGDVRIGTICAPLTLGTISGDVILESVEAGEIRLQTVSGDVRIGVGRGTRVWIDAASVSGDLESQLGLADQTPESGEEAAEPSAQQEVVPLHVKTVSGDVAIVRAAEAFTS
jgi:DUF4097 and DUF4098 domain-containing protein YvlB